MKKMKKVLSLILTVVMVLAMAAPAMAATVTISDSDGKLTDHTFAAYQIFTGTQTNDENQENKLGDVKWGNGINSTNFLTALKADTTIGSRFTNCTDALSVAEALSQLNTNEANIVAKLAYKNKSGESTTIQKGTATLADGYYLIVDTTIDVGESGASNAALLQVTKNIKITVKTDAPTATKKVYENGKDASDTVIGYNDVADYQIGDDVPFKFTSTLPDMSYYDSYTYVFHDTMGDGFVAPNSDTAFKVKIGETELTSDQFSVDLNPTDDCTFEIEIENLKQYEQNDVVVITFTAKLDTDATVGLNGNINKMKLEYTSNPDNPEKTGYTAEDEVIVFTYELDTTKVDGATLKDEEGNNIAPTTLAGAEFKLQNEENKWVIVNQKGVVTGWADSETEGSVLKSGESGVFKVVGLDDATYYLKETKAPTGYNILKDEIEVKINATTANGDEWSETADKALTALSVTYSKKGETDTTKIETSTGNVNSGIVGVTVANNMGAQLPSTGGIGTTIFYLVGILVMAGAVFFVIRSRKNEN